MSMRKTSMMIFKITIRMVVIAAVVAVFYIVCSKSFEYGSAVFSEEAMDEVGSGREVVVTIPNNTSIQEFGDILEVNGLIEDADMFAIQAVLYELKMYPGTYTFTTEQNVEAIIDTVNKEYWDAWEKEQEAKTEKKTEKKTEETTTESSDGQDGE